MNFFFISVLLVKLVTHCECVEKLREIYQWQYLDYAYPSEEHRLKALRTGQYVPQNNLPVGIEIWKNKLFVTVPRWKNGVPATLNYIPLDVASTSSPKLTPYPSWDANEPGNCNGLTTTYRIVADKCDRLWVLDSGTIGIGNTTVQVCPYAIHVFDLTSDRELRKYVLRPEDTNERTFIANIAIDIGVDCKDTFLYASDELGYGLISYSWELNKSWRFSHSFFMPDPLVGDYNIAGLNFQWGEEGIFGLALTSIQNDGYRRLLFHPLSSNREFIVSTEILRDSRKVEDSYHDFTPLESRGPLSHVTAHFMDDDGILYYNLVDQNSVGCWNSRNPYSPKFHDVIDRDDVALVFPSDVKVDRYKFLWVISDRMPVHLISSLDFQDVNFRIFNAPVNVALKGTVCESRHLY